MVYAGTSPTAPHAKRSLRFQLRAHRASRPLAERDAAATALAERVLALPELAEAPVRAACYVSTPEEPGTGPLLAALRQAGHTVLLPVLRDDMDLDWSVYEPASLETRSRGIQEPTGKPLGIGAPAEVAVIICPGLAAAADGSRLGRGGGSYDRALARASGSVLRVVLLYDDEVLPAVPTGDHDQPVHVIVTATRTLRTAAGARDRPVPGAASECPS